MALAERSPIAGKLVNCSKLRMLHRQVMSLVRNQVGLKLLSPLSSLLAYTNYTNIARTTRRHWQRHTRIAFVIDVGIAAPKQQQQQ
jgi:predicted nucleotidyltransferase